MDEEGVIVCTHCHEERKLPWMTLHLWEEEWFWSPLCEACGNRGLPDGYRSRLPAKALGRAKRRVKPVVARKPKLRYNRNIKTAE